MFHVKDISVFVFMLAMAWKHKKVILETASFLAFLFSQMNIKYLKAWVRVSSEYFLSNWECGKYATFKRNALVSLFLWKGHTKKIPRKPNRSGRTQETADNYVSNCALLRYGRACATASLHGLVDVNWMVWI